MVLGLLSHWLSLATFDDVSVFFITMATLHSVVFSISNQPSASWSHCQSTTMANMIDGHNSLNQTQALKLLTS